MTDDSSPSELVEDSPATGQMKARIFITTPTRSPWVFANSDQRKQSWHFIGVAASIVAVGLILLVLAIAVTSVVSADRQDRSAERERAGSATAEKSQIYAECINSPVPEVFVDCVYEKAEATQEAKHDQADLRAQQDMVSFAVGIYWWTLLGFMTSAAGVIALVGTFLAQQKLNRTQSRAYVEIRKAMVSRSATDGLTVTFVLFNRGVTPALDVQAFVYPKYYPPCEPKDAVTMEPRNPYGVRPITGFMSMLPVRKKSSFRAYGSVDFPFDYLSGEKEVNAGLLPAVVRIDCMITFRDAFGKRRKFFLRTGTASVGSEPTRLSMPNDDQFGVAAYLDPRSFVHEAKD